MGEWLCVGAGVLEIEERESGCVCSTVRKPQRSLQKWRMTTYVETTASLSRQSHQICFVLRRLLIVVSAYHGE